jgi:hypothetical protein
MEIDPLYVDVAIRRWQDVTKQQAMHSSTGATFDECRRARVAQADAKNQSALQQ